MHALACSLRRPSWGFALAAWLSTAPLALAHAGGGAGGLVSGLQHPWSGWDHIAAMVAVGLWGAQLGAPALWMLPVAFPLIMALGGMLGLLGLPLPGVEVGIAFSALLLGIMVAAQVRPRHPAWAAVIVGFFGLFHGHAHGTELPAGENGLLYSLGFVVATGVLHGIGIGLGEVRRWSHGSRLLRAAGALIALAGGTFLFGALRSGPDDAVPAATAPRS
ncbi:MAG: HupE/UreJ family protein [Verrucomicrobia bacterium]|nr:HupE/UreJ family protein [Verrucomicrobiota bacterium]